MTCSSAGEVSREYEQGLANAVRSVESATTPMQSEVRVVVRKDLGLASPEGMRYLQAMRGVGRA
jgi:hypothetical protein